MKYEDFENRIGESCVLSLGEAQLQLVLKEIYKTRPTNAEGLRAEPFSIVFEGPPEPLLPSLVYNISMGEKTYSLLIQATMGSGPQGILYEAVIN